MKISNVTDYGSIVGMPCMPVRGIGSYVMVRRWRGRDAIILKFREGNAPPIEAIRSRFGWELPANAGDTPSALP